MKMKILIPTEDTASGNGLYLEPDGSFTVGKGKIVEREGKEAFKIDKPAFCINYSQALEKLAEREAAFSCGNCYKSYANAHRQSLDLFRTAIQEALGLTN